MTARLYRVAVTHDVFVVATSKDDAERWVRANVTEWTGERLDTVEAHEGRMRDGVSWANTEVPWCADGCPEGAERWTCRDWIENGGGK